MHQNANNSRKLPPALVVAALGVVYGDIGTSPLYAFKESIGGAHGAGADHASVLGVLSMIFWAVTLVVSVKYVLIVLRASNGGEGGILALLALVLRQLPAQGRLTGIAVTLGLFGAAMFYGDSAITPAISVLSAVEGLEVISPRFKAFVIPLTLVVLIGLFAAQRSGTARIGSVFGPIMLLWFVTLGVLGALQIVRDPSVLAAIDPLNALAFFVAHPVHDLHGDGRGLSGGDRWRSAVCRHGSLRSRSDPSRLVLAGDAVPAAQLLRPGQPGPAGTRRRSQPVFPAGAGVAAVSAGRRWPRRPRSSPRRP